MKYDFEFICELMDSFTCQAHIQNTFNVIEQEKITGWENWLQVEFATFLSRYDSVGTWEREQSYYIDGRKRIDKNKAIVDFNVRKKCTKLNRMIALEFKQNTSSKTCITNMISDVQKIEDIRASSSTCMRSYWVIGIHPRNMNKHHTEDKKDIKRRILQKSKCTSFGLIEECILTKYIPNTGLAYTIF